MSIRYNCIKLLSLSIVLIVGLSGCAQKKLTHEKNLIAFKVNPTCEEPSATKLIAERIERKAKIDGSLLNCEGFSESLISHVLQHSTKDLNDAWFNEYYWKEKVADCSLQSPTVAYPLESGRECYTIGVLSSIESAVSFVQFLMLTELSLSQLDGRYPELDEALNSDRMLAVKSDLKSFFENLLNQGAGACLEGYGCYIPDVTVLRDMSIREDFSVQEFVFLSTLGGFDKDNPKSCPFLEKSSTVFEAPSLDWPELGKRLAQYMESCETSRSQ